MSILHPKWVLVPSKLSDPPESRTSNKSQCILLCKGINVTPVSDSESITQENEPDTQKQKQTQTQKQKQKQKKKQLYQCKTCDKELGPCNFSNNQLKKFKSKKGICTDCIFLGLVEQIRSKDENKLQRQPSQKVEGAVWETNSTTPTVEPKTPPDHNSMISFPSLPEPNIELCAICYEYFDYEYFDLNKNSMTRCRHRFHTNCLHKWCFSRLRSSMNPTCPICRISCSNWINL
jgi:hypothetical protein